MLVNVRTCGDKWKARMTMNAKDRAGRDVKAGDVVDVVLAGGFYTAQVVEVLDSSIQIPGQPMQPKMVVVGLTIPIPLNNKDVCNGVYVLQSAPSTMDSVAHEPNSAAGEEKVNGLKLIKPN